MKRLSFLLSIFFFFFFISQEANAGYSYGYRFPYSNNPEKSTYYADYLRSLSPSLAPKEKEALDNATISTPLVIPSGIEAEKPLDNIAKPVDGSETIAKHSLGVDLYGSFMLPMLGYAQIMSSVGTYGFNSITVGGGAGFRYKGDINKYFGIMLNLSYNALYNMGLNELGNYRESFYLSHAANIQLLFTVQKETLKSKAGFVPLFGIGADFSAFLGYSSFLSPETVAILSASSLSMPITIAPGVVALLGFRYNFSNNIFFGISATYTLNFLFQMAGTEYLPNDYSVLDRMVHNFKLSFEIGAKL